MQQLIDWVTNYDDNYFNHKYQGIPKNGYTKIIEKMFDVSGIEIKLNTPFNVADKEDIWMHVKGVPGSHVVIRVRENLPTESVIKSAALLAKKNSKAAKENSATVVYCQRRFVKKESGMNDGQVKVDYKNSHQIVV